MSHMNGSSKSATSMRMISSDRPMPNWINETHDRVGPRPPATPPSSNQMQKIIPPPLPKKNHIEPDYEVIEFSNQQQYSNASPMRPKTPDVKRIDGLKCQLCGSSNPWVRCDQCGNQIFCASCDDMFHRHPKRQSHIRKAMEKSQSIKPPLPPKTDLQFSAPVPPPRRNKKAFPSPLPVRRDQSGLQQSQPQQNGTLKRSAINLSNRPLPETPTQASSSRSSTPNSKSVFDSIQRPPSITLEKIKNKASATLNKMALLQQRYRQHQDLKTNGSKINSTTQLNDQLSDWSAPSSPSRLRSGSMSSGINSMSNQRPSMDSTFSGFPNQMQHHHQHNQIDPMQHMRQPMRSSTSVFNLNQVGNQRQMHLNPGPWNSMGQAQSMAQINCAGCNHQGWNHCCGRDGWMDGSSQNLHGSNMSLNMPPGGYYPSQQLPVAGPPPTWFNNWNGPPNMYPYPYPVMNGMMTLPRPPRSRVGSRAASPALSIKSRKSMMSRNHKRNSYAEHELTDDEDSEDDRRSMRSHRSELPGQRRRSSNRKNSLASQSYDDEIDEFNNVSKSKSESRSTAPITQKRNERSAVNQKQSTPNEIISNRRPSGNLLRDRTERISNSSKTGKVYSDSPLSPDSENEPPTKALVQAKILEKLSKEKEAIANKQTNKKHPTNTKPIEVDEESEEEEEEEQEEEEEIEEVSDEDNKKAVEDIPTLGPPPSTPDHDWECEFCTYVNEANIKICAVCCKTPIRSPTKPIQNDKTIKKSTSSPVTKKTTITSALKATPKTTNSTGTTTTNKKIENKDITNVTKQISNLTKFSQSEDDSETPNGTKKKDETKINNNMSLDDIWATLEEDIKSAAEATKRSNDRKILVEQREQQQKMKTSTACGPSPPREYNQKTKINSSVISTGTSPPPQSISTQTYDILPNTIKSHGDQQPSSINDEIFMKTGRSYSIASPSQHVRENSDSPPLTINNIENQVQSLPPTPPLRNMSPIGIRKYNNELNLMDPESMVNYNNERNNFQYREYRDIPIMKSDRYRSTNDLRREEPYLSRRPSIGDMLNYQKNQSNWHDSMTSPQWDSFEMRRRDMKPRDAGIELVMLLKEAEHYKFTAEELQAALKHCGDTQHPILWLRDNWSKLIKTVQTLATKYGQEQKENIIGTISSIEAREALRLHRGNVWHAVTECIEQRQRKYREIANRSNYSREDIVTALTAHHGNIELALIDLGKTQIKPFLMRIWGSPNGVENDSGNLNLDFDDKTNKLDIDPSIHDFLNANAESLQLLKMKEFRQDSHSPQHHQQHQNQQFLSKHPSRHDLSIGSMSNLSVQSFGNHTDYSEGFESPSDGTILTNNSNNPNLLKDIETLIANMEQNQAKQNESMLKNIESMLGGLLEYQNQQQHTSEVEQLSQKNQEQFLDHQSDMLLNEFTQFSGEDSLILRKSPILKPKLSKQSDINEINSIEMNVRNFVSQHIQDITPDLVEHVEKDLEENNGDDYENHGTEKVDDFIRQLNEIERNSEIYNSQPHANRALPNSESSEIVIDRKSEINNLQQTQEPNKNLPTSGQSEIDIDRNCEINNSQQQQPNKDLPASSRSEIDINRNSEINNLQQQQPNKVLTTSGRSEIDIDRNSEINNLQQQQPNKGLPTSSRSEIDIDRNSEINNLQQQQPNKDLPTSSRSEIDINRNSEINNLQQQQPNTDLPTSGRSEIDIDRNSEINNLQQQQPNTDLPTSGRSEIDIDRNSEINNLQQQQQPNKDLQTSGQSEIDIDRNSEIINLQQKQPNKDLPTSSRPEIDINRNSEINNLQQQQPNKDLPTSGQSEIDIDRNSEINNLQQQQQPNKGLPTSSRSEIDINRNSGINNLEQQRQPNKDLPNSEINNSQQQSIKGLSYSGQSEIDIKDFVSKHIKDIVPDLVEQLRRELQQESLENEKQTNYKDTDYIVQQPEKEIDISSTVREANINIEELITTASAQFENSNIINDTNLNQTPVVTAIEKPIANLKEIQINKSINEVVEYVDLKESHSDLKNENVTQSTIDDELEDLAINKNMESEPNTSEVSPTNVENQNKNISTSLSEEHKTKEPIVDEDSESEGTDDENVMISSVIENKKDSVALIATNPLNTFSTEDNNHELKNEQTLLNNEILDQATNFNEPLISQLEQEETSFNEGNERKVNSPSSTQNIIISDEFEEIVSVLNHINDINDESYNRTTFTLTDHKDILNRNEATSSTIQSNSSNYSNSQNTNNLTKIDSNDTVKTNEERNDQNKLENSNNENETKVSNDYYLDTSIDKIINPEVKNLKTDTIPETIEIEQFNTEEIEPFETGAIKNEQQIQWFETTHDQNPDSILTTIETEQLTTENIEPSELKAIEESMEQIQPSETSQDQDSKVDGIPTTREIEQLTVENTEINQAGVIENEQPVQRFETTQDQNLKVNSIPTSTPKALLNKTIQNSRTEEQIKISETDQKVHQINSNIIQSLQIEDENSNQNIQDNIVETIEILVSEPISDNITSIQTNEEINNVVILEANIISEKTNEQISQNFGLVTDSDEQEIQNINEITFEEVNEMPTTSSNLKQNSNQSENENTSNKEDYLPQPGPSKLPQVTKKKTGKRKGKNKRYQNKTFNSSIALEDQNVALALQPPSPSRRIDQRRKTIDDLTLIDNEVSEHKILQNNSTKIDSISSGSLLTSSDNQTEHHNSSEALISNLNTIDEKIIALNEVHHEIETTLLNQNKPFNSFSENLQPALNITTNDDQNLLLNNEHENDIKTNWNLISSKTTIETTIENQNTNNEVEDYLETTKQILNTNIEENFDISKSLTSAENDNVFKGNEFVPETEIVLDNKNLINSNIDHDFEKDKSATENLSKIEEIEKVISIRNEQISQQSQEEPMEMKSTSDAFIVDNILNRPITNNQQAHVFNEDSRELENLQQTQISQDIKLNDQDIQTINEREPQIETTNEINEQGSEVDEAANEINELEPEVEATNESLIIEKLNSPQISANSEEENEDIFRDVEEPTEDENNFFNHSMLQNVDSNDSSNLKENQNDTSDEELFSIQSDYDDYLDQTKSEPTRNYPLDNSYSITSFASTDGFISPTISSSEVILILNTESGMNRESAVISIDKDTYDENMSLPDIANKGDGEISDSSNQQVEFKEKNIPLSTQEEITENIIDYSSSVKQEDGGMEEATTSNLADIIGTRKAKSNQKQNLSELVEDTQRLIKQMKEEIKSDIASFEEDDDFSDDWSDDYDDDEELDEEEELGEEEYDEEDDYDSEEYSGTEEEYNQEEYDEKAEDESFLVEENDHINTDPVTASNTNPQEDELEETHENINQSLIEPREEINITSEMFNEIQHQDDSEPHRLSEIISPFDESNDSQDLNIYENSINSTNNTNDNSFKLNIETSENLALNQENFDHELQANDSAQRIDTKPAHEMNDIKTKSDSSSESDSDSISLNSKNNTKKQNILENNNSIKSTNKIASSSGTNKSDNHLESSVNIVQNLEIKSVINKKSPSNKINSKTPNTKQLSTSSSKLEKLSASGSKITKETNSVVDENIKVKKIVPITATTNKTTVKSNTGAISKIPKLTNNDKNRSKSFSGGPSPLISSVKKIQLELFNKQQEATKIIKPSKITPPRVIRKNSITETITKLMTPKQTPFDLLKKTGGSSSFKSSTSAAGATKTESKIPKIPKKKYHETCFSDENPSSSSEDESAIMQERLRRKQSEPVFRTYPSLLQDSQCEPADVMARKFVEDGLCNNYVEAELAAALVELKFQQEAALWAAKECSDLEQAISLLQQECELCTDLYPMNEIVSMLKCTHACCKDCAKNYFTIQITDRSINDCNCPYCKVPELHDPDANEDEILEYFSNLDIFLKNILDKEVHELFQRKLRDRSLIQDPNFKWCVQCSSGFFARPKQKRLICPDCGSITCGQCRKPWEKQHDGLSCDKYQEWLDSNDPDKNIKGVLQHLATNGIDCPKCKFRFSLSRGGCMHFTCTQCKYEFCYGCGKPFMMGAKCTVSPYCARLGLHSHHPRNCLFYLRDKEPKQLQDLLRMHDISFDEEPQTEKTDLKNKLLSKCPVPLQKETPTGLIDTICNGDVPNKHAGLCRQHFVEYLVSEVSKANIDPLPILDLTDCVQELRRRGISLPERGPWDTDEIYRGMCSKIVEAQIPLN